MEKSLFTLSVVATSGRPSCLIKFRQIMSIHQVGALGGEL